MLVTVLGWFNRGSVAPAWNASGTLVIAFFLGLVAGCGGVNRRLVTAPVIDEHTGTVYAFETNDHGGHWGDSTVAIICNEELTGVCYRVRPVDALDEEDLRALQEALRTLRARRAAE